MLLSLTGLLFCLVVLPALLVRGCDREQIGGTGLVVSVFLRRSRRLIRLELEEYLVGVVAAEMPARFSLEALKAQAVAARTLTIRRLRRFGGRGCRHLARADLCDQAADGQAWLSDTDLRRLWGWRYGRLRGRISRAIQETRGLVLLYQHRPIEAAYHSTCGGATEAAGQVWGRSIPYLISVSCGFDRVSPRFRSQVRLDRREFARRLSINLPRDVLAGAGPLDLHILGRTASNRVTGVAIGSVSFTGQAFRAALGLGSTNFSYQLQGPSLVFTVQGYGHGVGLCQYGAEGMARQGADYLQILRHYYTGVKLGRLARPART